MCYPLPGPRCATVSEKRMARADASGDVSAYRAARLDYERTPKFRRQLRQKLEELRSQVASDAVEGKRQELLTELATVESLLTRRTREYNKLIRAWRKSRSEVAADTTAAYPTITKLVEDAKEPVEARRIGIENLRSRGGLYGSFSTRELSAMFGVPLSKEAS